MRRGRGWKGLRGAARRLHGLIRAGQGLVKGVLRGSPVRRVCPTSLHGPHPLGLDRPSTRKTHGLSTRAAATLFTAGLGQIKTRAPRRDALVSFRFLLLFSFSPAETNDFTVHDHSHARVYTRSMVMKYAAWFCCARHTSHSHR